MIKRKHKASASHGRPSLACSMILCMLLLLQGCGDLTPCEGNIGHYTMDPNGTSCTQRCQCNTLVYEGDCVDGKCVSLEREPCTAKGQKRNCLLPKTPDRKCDLGVQICHPEELLHQKRWSDCVPFQVVEREDTVELCFDGLDNDCDGKVDLGDPDCAKFCRPGSQEPCYTGPKGTLNVGECKSGIRICQENHEWGSCDGEITPQEEICGDGKDNNCDGSIDEGCPCHYLNKSYGVCKDLKRDDKGNCPKPADYNETEICDGKDNNCNGIIDEGCPCHYLDKPHGVCKDLKRDDKGNCLKPADYNETEICGDGKDNNCNGAIDDGCPCHYLDKPHGVCKDLKSDSSGNCAKPVDYSETEICGNGKDNNCNGAIDEGCPCHYLDKPHGVCKDLKRDSSSHCPKPADHSETEICDGKDNNCNGIIDEGCPCHYLNKSFGVCKDLKRDSYGNCPKPADYNDTEICDTGKDNNCDGAIDEGCPCHYLDKPYGVCKDAKRNNKGECSKPADYRETEICDGQDNDCNGQIDDNLPPSHSCANQQGVCKGSHQRRCINGQWQPCNDADYQAHHNAYSTTDPCDGLDNNCNGTVDEEPCPTGQTCLHTTCLPVTCMPNESRCAGKYRIQCESDGQTWSIKGFCDYGCYMNGNVTYCKCPGERLAGQDYCNGKIYKCELSTNDSGTGIEQSTCSYGCFVSGSNAYCACIGNRTTAGRYCHGNDRYYCPANSTAANGGQAFYNRCSYGCYESDDQTYCKCQKGRMSGQHYCIGDDLYLCHASTAASGSGTIQDTCVYGCYNSSSDAYCKCSYSGVIYNHGAYLCEADGLTHVRYQCASGSWSLANCESSQICSSGSCQ